LTPPRPPGSLPPVPLVRPCSLSNWARDALAALSENFDGCRLEPAGPTRRLATGGRAAIVAYATGKISAGGPAEARDEALAVLSCAGLLAGWREGGPLAKIRWVPARPEVAGEEDPPPREDPPPTSLIRSAG
jgi:hypothetical protein